MDTKKIGAFLKQCRKEKNLTQEQLAEKFGVSAIHINFYSMIFFHKFDCITDDS